MSVQSISMPQFVDTSNQTTVQNKSTDDKNLFLKMMVTQMSNQDPMNPTDSSEFMNQITQFTNIESQKNMESSLKELVDVQKSLNLFSVLNNAVGIIGKNVDVTDSSGNVVSGKIEKVNIKDDAIKLFIGGKEYEYTNLKNIY